MGLDVTVTSCLFPSSSSHCPTSRPLEMVSTGIWSCGGGVRNGFVDECGVDVYEGGRESKEELASPGNGGYRPADGDVGLVRACVAEGGAEACASSFLFACASP